MDPTDYASVIWTDAGAFAAAEAQAYDYAFNEPMVECVDGKLRTATEKQAYEDALWQSILAASQS